MKARRADGISPVERWPGTTVIGTGKVPKAVFRQARFNLIDLFRPPFGKVH
jgi:hypothetical protein